jgi:hypothetical protein
LKAGVCVVEEEERGFAARFRERLGFKKLPRITPLSKMPPGHDTKTAQQNKLTGGLVNLALLAALMLKGCSLFCGSQLTSRQDAWVHEPQG